MKNGDDDELLREMLREAERVLDRQFRMMEEHDDKTEQAIALGVATLGGGVALATFARAGTAPLAMGFVVFGAALNLLALLWLLEAYVGLSRKESLRMGPNLRWLAAKANDRTWSLEDHLLTLIKDVPAHWDANLAALRAVAGRRRSGLLMLLVSMSSYAMGTLYILGGGIFG